MASFRFKALEDVLDRKPIHVETPSVKISDYFSKRVFVMDKMREYLADDALQSVNESMNTGKRIPRAVADQVASAMKDWAISMGATHYTHWFQPLTGSTAEKHDSFFTPLGGGKAIEKFAGANLTQQEPDASSFPSGGIRNTFEARGYTAWDPSSPAFLIGRTLCIPTIFISYTGEALDNKMPLLKALHSIDKSATRVCKYFDKNVTKVISTLGWEQEYFLIDSSLYNTRPDIQFTGRTLFGHNPAKGQQLDDHYFGSIPERIHMFMRDFETESHLLGIPVTTRHNEVAPNQFEVAPMFEETNLANDHNLLLMDLLEKIARKHNFRILLHEKPFAGLNGSGKHNNWSLATDTGVNLLSPGKNPKTNLQFLTFMVNTIAAIHDYADVLRAHIANAGNDHRLGANEAPPAIISVFIGSELTRVLDRLEKSVKAGKMTPDDKTQLKLDIGKIPEILLDNTDRNRTSPFAFTGNKFEFRAVGSTANCGVPMTALNVMVSQQLGEFADKIDIEIGKGVKKDEAIIKELQKLIKHSRNIRFEGNGYGEEWVAEAKKRGLSNVKDAPRAIVMLDTKKVIDLYVKQNVLTERELKARVEIELEKYKMQIQIESRICGDIALSHIIPVALGYQTMLIQNVLGINQILNQASALKATKTQLQIVEEISERVEIIKTKVDEMVEERKKANKIEDTYDAAIAYCDKVKPTMGEIRYQVDKLELLVDDQLWPMPKLRELLFTR
ncbi:glutamine synthetase type III [Cryomorpha ignava]|uniref:Glutamine synthetase type III n=1 Tax=Cryomorpha ignava TaxID=101383 RepID=A0A7K3WMI0_9FLAO|nr:glutamine synthetase III [Cryomorpha ignava]NEN22860.1 glutamine synthetase type III [Cryomorpha ignava]